MPAGAVDFLARPELDLVQRQRLREMFDAILPGNRFYSSKIGQCGLPLDRLHEPDVFCKLPFTRKAELIADQQAHPPYGTDLSYPLGDYTRMHQTSGTSGQPLRWLDTPQSWDWMLGCWRQVYRAAEITPSDRFFFPFSFGPFLGFWTAFEAATRFGCLALAGGGMTSLARLKFLVDNQVSIVVCTPTYALRLLEVAREHGIALGKETPGYAVRAVIVGGEPGGNIPATRRHLEQGWHARLFDQSGMTEIGPVTCECTHGNMHVLDGDFLAESIDSETGKAAPPGAVGELVLTNLGRWGSPLLRYRTGDLVRIVKRSCECGRNFLTLAGGILGRTDDMIHVRGNNLYPSSLEAVIRRFPEVAEYRVSISHDGALAEVHIAVEPVSQAIGADLADRLAQAIREELLFRATVTMVPGGTLPRFEMKAKRIVHEKAGALSS